MEEQQEKITESHNVERNIKEQIIIPLMVKINKNLELANKGDPLKKSNEKENSKVKALKESLIDLKLLVYNIIPDVEEAQRVKWLRTYRKKEDRDEHPYDEEETDEKILFEMWETFNMMIRGITSASITKSTKDDFVKYENSESGEKIYVNNKFYDFLDETELAYSEVNRIMAQNGLRMYRRDDEDWEKSLEEQIDEDFLGA